RPRGLEPVPNRRSGPGCVADARRRRRCAAAAGARLPRPHARLPAGRGGGGTGDPPGAQPAEPSHRVGQGDPGGSAKRLTPGQPGHGATSLDSSAKAARWKKLFLSYDKDKSGTITFKEAPAPTASSSWSLQNWTDEDGSGAIEFDEFCTFVQARKQASNEVPSSVGRAIRLAMAREKVRSEAELRELFAKSDLDNDNNMSVYELSRFFREVLRLSQHEVSEFHIKKLFKVLDADLTGSINQDEFLLWIQKNVDLSRGAAGFVSSRFGGSAAMTPAATMRTAGGGFGHTFTETGRLPSLSGPPGSAPGVGRPAPGLAPAEARRPSSTPPVQAHVAPGGQDIPEHPRRGAAEPRGAAAVRSGFRRAWRLLQSVRAARGRIPLAHRPAPQHIGLRVPGPQVTPPQPLPAWARRGAHRARDEPRGHRSTPSLGTLAPIDCPLSSSPFLPACALRGTASLTRALCPLL
ncbi:unnamed protein product, partial [Prorocentrum cordatum]